jgi:hypothetical protein
MAKGARMSEAGGGRAGGKGVPFAKIVVVLAIAFGVGVGLCGLSFVVASAGFKSHEEFGVDSIGIASFSLIVMVMSAAALVLALVAWAVAGVIGSLRETGEPQTLMRSEETPAPRTQPDSKDDERKPE